MPGLRSKYYCTKCQHNHFFSSEIGKKHLDYRENNQILNIKQVQKTVKKSNQDKISADKILGKVELEKKVIKDEEVKEQGSANRVIRFIRDYQRSYRKGVESYGVWWKVFQLSIWSIIMIFLLTASVIFIIFLPKVDFINWILR